MRRVGWQSCGTVPIRRIWLQDQRHLCNSGSDRILADLIGGIVQLCRFPFNLGVPDPETFNMPIESSLKLATIVTIVYAPLTDGERELINDVVNEIDRVHLRVFLIDFEGTNTCGVVDRRILEPAQLLSAFSFESQKLNINLNMMIRNLFLVACWCAIYASVPLVSRLRPLRLRMR